MGLNPFSIPGPDNNTQTCQHPMKLLLDFYKPRVQGRLTLLLASAINVTSLSIY